MLTTARLAHIVVGIGVLLALACTPADRSVSDARAGPETYLDLGNANAGRELTAQFGCGACHVIPGVRDATALIGPSLDHVSQRTYIAGVLRNTPENLIEWIMSPRSIKRATVMPDIVVSRQEASDIAAYLYTIR